MQHPNVCRIFGLVQAEGLTFFTMEPVSGGALRETLERYLSGR